MYHYIREGSAELPWFRYLHMDDYKKQLDLFQAEYNFITKQETLQSIRSKTPTQNAAILTFDDGLADHYEAAKELYKRGLWGIFYVPTAPYHSNKLLDVHRVHMLIGKYGGTQILAALREIMTDEMIQDGYIEKFHAVTYRRQDNDDATKTVKQLLNYYVSYDVKQALLDHIMEKLFPEEKALCKSYYLTTDEMTHMVEMGMIIGGHSVSHPVFSRLNYDQQKKEIVDCFNYLEQCLGALEMKTFCYPYGGDHSFNNDTLAILIHEKVDFTFSVEQRDITSDDLTYRMQYLPRYDCNQFPFGAASMGVASAESVKHKNLEAYDE